MRLPILPLLFSLAIAMTLTACGGGGGGGDGDDPANAGTADYVVDAVGGDDTGAGTDADPFKTITRALLVVQDGEVVRIRPGVYSELGNGERFPLLVPTGVTLLGNTNPFKTGDGVKIHGNGAATKAISPDFELFTTIIPGERSRLIGLTIQHFDVHSLPDTLDAVVAAAFPGVDIRNCLIRGGGDQGILFMKGSEGLRVQKCRIENNRQGLMFVDGGGLGTAIEETTVTNNTIGIFYLSSDGADLGGGNMGSKGGNVIAGNSGADLHVFPGIDVSARNNVWDGFPTPTHHVGGTAPSGSDLWTLDGNSDIDTTGARSLNPPLAPGT